MSDAGVMVSELRSQFPTGIIGVPETEILLSWTVEAHVPGLRQLTYEIEVSNDHDFSSITSSTKSESDRQVEVAARVGLLVTERAVTTGSESKLRRVGQVGRQS